MLVVRYVCNYSSPYTLAFVLVWQISFMYSIVYAVIPMNALLNETSITTDHIATKSNYDSDLYACSFYIPRDHVE